ncbi:MAG: hypothetical protein GF355_15190 [Candidatus Eisenbacteria bacterium]|nr:hypothetical protein [Candidatus Eisenbacteria bacterium]
MNALAAALRAWFVGAQLRAGLGQGPTATAASGRGRHAGFGALGYGRREPKVYIADRPTALFGESIASRLHDIGIDHEFLVVYDSDGRIYAAGLGGEVLCTVVRDHSDEVPYNLEEVHGVDVDCVKSYMEIGEGEGIFFLFINDCYRWVDNVIRNSTPHIHEHGYTIGPFGLYDMIPTTNTRKAEPGERGHVHYNGEKAPRYPFPGRVTK